MIAFICARHRELIVIGCIFAGNFKDFDAKTWLYRHSSFRVTTSVAMWSGIGFDVSGAKKQKAGVCRRWAFLWWENGRGSLRYGRPGAEHLRSLPCRLHWFLPGEGCRGRREKAATLMLLMWFVALLCPCSPVSAFGADTPPCTWPQHQWQKRDGNKP